MPKTPSKWDARLVPTIKKLAAEGYSMRQIAKAVDVNVTSLIGWTKKKEELKDFPDWKDSFDDQVEEALGMKCIGYEKTIECEKLTATGEIVVVKETKYYPPDTRAIEFWLKNRKPKEWLDNLRMDVNIGALSNKELVRLAQLAIEKLNTDEAKAQREKARG